MTTEVLNLDDSRCPESRLYSIMGFIVKVVPSFIIEKNNNEKNPFR
jgi:hypothetical protein